MKRFWLFAVAAIVAATASVASADSTTMKPTVIPPSAIKWMPGSGALKGAMIAALEGDWSKPGPWTVRMQLPDGVKFPAHYHPDTERVTLLSGTFMLGFGATWDTSKLTALPAGSYVVIPGGVRHYGMTKGVTVMQLSGTKPFAMMDAGKTGM